MLLLCFKNERLVKWGANSMQILFIYWRKKKSVCWCEHQLYSKIFARGFSFFVYLLLSSFDFWCNTQDPLCLYDKTSSNRIRNIWHTVFLLYFIYCFRKNIANESSPEYQICRKLQYATYAMGVGGDRNSMLCFNITF